MQTLRKKTSPLKYKNETTRFLSDGVSFKAKLIGILEVSEARGDRMCQEALSDLKMAIRAAGEHKQRITINIAIDGLRLRDEKTGDCLYHHPVHKISFIAQDMTDSRAFGYIFGSPDTGHRFFGIKTDKAASQVVIAMRDLFQVVFALKKKEIELAKQHLEKHYVPTSPLFPRSSASKCEDIPQVSEKCRSDIKGCSATSDLNTTGTAVADLVDLELELNSLQQGLNQMERITPSDPYGSKDDPFGDSFISYPINKPILPPPPSSSGRERSSRTSDSSSIFSPKTPHTSSIDTNVDPLTSGKESKKNFSFSHDFSSSREDPSTGDWFSPSAIFEETPIVPPEPKKDDKHELAKQEIMSQFDVFTELDPLGTGRSKPYIDKKHFFQELKNPPKKALNDLVATTGAVQEFNINFPTVTPKTQQSAVYTNTSSVFSADPFGEDPFVKEDPFADSDFAKQDPFESEFANFSSAQLNNLDKNQKNNLQAQLQNSNLSRSPKSSSLDKQMSVVSSTSPRTVQFSKPNTFDTHFEGRSDKKWHKLNELHENPSLDMSSESECAPEPPPRPIATLVQIKPPPLPPKKQSELVIKPPPRPPHTDDVTHYEYLERFEIKGSKAVEKTPPIPVPSRKAKFDSDFSTPPERPKKSFDLQSSEEDYLTPISFPEASSSPSVLLPPPQRSSKRQQVASETKVDNLEGLDITLSQLTLSGLNELATKLNIPPSQLSNMTLVQLTNYLSNFIKTKSQADDDSQFTSFHADFAANFNNLNSTPSESSTFDRYAVFRELQEEIKQTKIDTEPEQIQEEKEKLENTVNSNVTLELKPLNEETNSTEDRYAALREIVEVELKESELQTDETNQNNPEDEQKENFTKSDTLNEDEEKEAIKEINLVNKENNFIIEEPEKEIISKTCIIEYSNADGTEEKVPTSISRSPVKSPIRQTLLKSPVPNVITDIIQNSARLTSGSLSDVLSGSSPEVDNTGSTSDVGKKASDATGESWAIFDQASVPLEPVKELPAAQSEEGASPWSSDSKEFGNGSPSEWSRDEKDRWGKGKRGRDEGWWDTSAEPEAHYYPPNRRSTDSYDEDYYQSYDRPQRRRRQQPTANWQHGQQSVGGGHSSSSRDVSPWEEEQPRRREGRRDWSSRHSRGHSFERHARERRHTDSWDDEDDYEYDEEHGTRFHWPDRPDRHSSRESDRQGVVREKENQRWAEDWSEDRRRRRRREAGQRDSRERWCCPDWEQTEPHGVLDKSSRYPPGRRSNIDRRDRPPHEEPRDNYYNRETPDSPWEDEYSNEPDETSSPHYLTAKRTTWKQRPSSASEMDRKTGEIKSRHYLAAVGGSDGERDRNRYKPGGRRSRSRDSQYSEPTMYRHKVEQTRNPHRNKPHAHSKTPESEFGDTPQRLKAHAHSKTPESEFGDTPHRTKPYALSKTSESEFGDTPPPPLKLQQESESGKKSFATRKKQFKESPKSEENVCGTFPKKSTSRTKNLFENDFVAEGGSGRPKFNFENDFDKVDLESSAANRSLKGLRQQSMFEKSRCHLDRESKEKLRVKELKLSPRYQTKSKSLFEDDFSPSERSEHLPEDSSISSIKEEEDSLGGKEEEEDSFGAENFENATNGRKRILAKNRLSGAKGDHLKKSGSVNIFGRENDPFDDDFFSGNIEEEKTSPRSTELRWTDDFEEYEANERN